MTHTQVLKTTINTDLNHQVQVQEIVDGRSVVLAITKAKMISYSQFKGISLSKATPIGWFNKYSKGRINKTQT